MLNLSAIELVTGALLVAVYFFVSYSIIKGGKRSYSAGFYRNFANIPITHLIFLIGATPLLFGEKVILFLRNLWRRRQKIKDAEFIGNKQSLVFHQRGCEYAEVMGFDKRIALKSVEDAKKKGYRPCATCKPS